MKKQKRSTKERSFNKGYQVGLAGKSMDKCPYETGAAREQWVLGWREGRTDNWDGLTGVAGVHKMAMH